MALKKLGLSWFFGGALLVVVVVVFSSIFMGALDKKRYTIKECNAELTLCKSWTEWR